MIICQWGHDKVTSRKLILRLRALWRPAACKTITAHKLPLRFSTRSCPDSHKNTSVLPVPLHHDLNQITGRRGCWIPRDQHTPPQRRSLHSKFFDLPSQFSIMAYYKRSRKLTNLLFVLGFPFQFLHLPRKIVALSTTWTSTHIPLSPKNTQSWLLTILYHRRHLFRGNEETKGEATLCLQVYYWSINSVSERSIVARRSPLLPLPKLSPFRVWLRPS